MIQLLRTYLRAYRYWLLAVLVLQAVQAAASLLLPSLNADIIDKGVLPGDTAYIWSIGAMMLVVSAVQVVFSVGAVYCGSKAAMGFGRDVRAALFQRVVAFSAKEVNLFGAPSLITRITNDVQQVQMLVLMTCTMVVAAPMIVVFGVFMAMRQDLGLSWLLAVSLPLLMIILGHHRVAHGSAVPADAGASRQHQRRAARADCRHARRAGVRARASRDGAVPHGEPGPDGDLAQGRAPDGADVPHDDVLDERIEHRGHLVRRAPDRQRRRCPSARSSRSSRISR